MREQQGGNGEDGTPVRGPAGGVRRRRTLRPVILAPVVLSPTPPRRQRAVAALSRLFTLRWDEHGQTVDDGQDDRCHDVVEDNG